MGSNSCYQHSKEFTRNIPDRLVMAMIWLLISLADENNSRNAIDRKMVDNISTTDRIERLNDHADACPYGNEETCPGRRDSPSGADLCAKCTADNELAWELMVADTYDHPPVRPPTGLTQDGEHCRDCGNSLTAGSTPSGILRKYCPKCAGEMTNEEK